MAGLISDAQATTMQAIIARSLDKSLPLERNTPGTDTSGHATESWSSAGNVACNVINPKGAASATLLQLYGGVIGSQRFKVIRAMNTADVRQGDRVTLEGLKWNVHAIESTESYTWTKEYLILTVT